MATTIVVGLGNPLRGDDGVGIEVARKVRLLIGDEAQDVAIVELSVGGLGLMDALVGYRRAAIVDAMVTGAMPGTIRSLQLSELSCSSHAISSHDTDFATALELGRVVGLSLPQEILIMGLEAAATDYFCETLSPKVQAGVIPAAKDIVAWVHRS